MRTYETTFIINPQADDSALDRQVTDVTKIITDSGGTVAYENRIGTRRLAYEIDGLTQGYYTQLIYQSGTEVLDQLDRFFKLEEPYVRYMTVIYEGKIPSVDDPLVPTLRDDKDREDDDKGRRGPRHAGRDDDRPRRPAPTTPAPAAAAPVTETPVSETPAPAAPATETPAPAAPATETPAAETPAPAAPATETPAPEAPAAEEDDIL